jgi:hypothetical protein
MKVLRVGLKIKKKKKPTLINKINILNIINRVKGCACEVIRQYRKGVIGNESKVLRKVRF